MMRCTFKVGRGAVHQGELLTIRDGRATVLVDGFAASDTIPLSDLLEAFGCPSRPTAALVAARALATAQAEDDGLWFITQSAAEAYLQQELRRLHAAIEGERPITHGESDAD